MKFLHTHKKKRRMHNCKKMFNAIEAGCFDRVRGGDRLIWAVMYWGMSGFQEITVLDFCVGNKL